MNINEVFSGSFLKADDLKGKTVTVTISAIEIKEFDDGKKIVIAFQGKDKCLVVNKTNANIIAENLRSQDTDDWVGERITLTIKKVEFQGRLVPAIRVVLLENKPAVRPSTAAPAVPAPVPEEPPAGQPAPPPHDPEDAGSPMDDVPF